jgi:hypothetical protein
MRRTPKGRGSRADEASKVRVWLHTHACHCGAVQVQSRKPASWSRQTMKLYKRLVGLYIIARRFHKAWWPQRRISLGVAGVGASPHDNDVAPA